MDWASFLKERTSFIRQLYTEASSPFVERKRKIVAGEGPFVPSYEENGDLPFEVEWLEADESLDVIGQMCVCLLASALQLFIKEWMNELNKAHGAEALLRAGIGRPEDDKAALKKGWINGYRTFFSTKLNIHWDQGPSNLDLLEEIVLTRNRAQHPEDIGSLRIKQSEEDFKKHPRAFFADDTEVAIFSDPARPEEEWHLWPWRLNITQEKLFTAIEEVDQFCEWLEEQYERWSIPG